MNQYADNPQPAARRGKRPEDALQEAVHAYLSAVLQHNAYHTFVDKAGRRSALQGAMLQRRGVKSGIPDCLIWRNGIGYGIELKTSTGRLTDSQEREHPKMRAAGVDVVVCRSVADVAATLERWGFDLAPTRYTPDIRDAMASARLAKPVKRTKPRAEKPSTKQLRRVAVMRGRTMF